MRRVRHAVNQHVSVIFDKMITTFFCGVFNQIGHDFLIEQHRAMRATSDYYGLLGVRALLTDFRFQAHSQGDRELPWAIPSDFQWKVSSFLIKRRYP